MAKSFKQMVGSIPGLGSGLEVIRFFLKAPALYRQLVEEQGKAQAQAQKAVDEQAGNLEELKTATSSFDEKLAKLQLLQDNLQHQFSLLETENKKSKDMSQKSNSQDELFADDHVLDNFYASFEDRFRGSEEEIEKRLNDYLPYFNKSKLNFNKTPVLDIGSGRGELLKLLKKHAVKAIGLDINFDMVDRAKKKGLEAVQGEALAFLQKSKSQSFGAITGFHIVEHIPFNMLMRIFTEAHRTLAEKGLVIFETPNPENVVVGSDTFHMDPSHLHPLPPALLAFALETCGFSNIEIKRLHPDEQGKDIKLPEAAKNRLFGPRDYAVIAYK